MRIRYPLLREGGTSVLILLLVFLLVWDPSKGTQAVVPVDEPYLDVLR
ncbi:MAG: hypothetical protein ACFFCZ_12720 [Promethearchaeota archaeon]